MFGSSASIGSQPGTHVYNFSENGGASNENAEAEAEIDEELEGWDSLPDNVYIDYDIGGILKETRSLLLSRRASLDELQSEIDKLTVQKQFKKIYPLKVQLAQLDRETSDEVINSKLNILKNIMKEELKFHGKDSLRTSELNGWIQSIRDFQKNYNLSIKAKVETHIVEFGNVVVEGMGSAATQTTEKVVKLGSRLNSILDRFGVYSTINNWGEVARGQVTEKLSTFNPFSSESKKAEDPEEK